MKAPLIFFVIWAFILTSLVSLPLLQADEFSLPIPGVMVHLSPPLDPPLLKGIKVHPENPFRFDFILDKGDSQLKNDQLKNESTKLIKYFLASITIPEKDLWVNLSPYEKDRIVPVPFGMTEMGRDLLAEDYILKQITASLIYPEDEIGKKFWKQVYTKAIERYGTSNISVNTFNKVWIVPEKAVVYENAKAGTAYVVESRLKVMLEEDYLSLAKHEGFTTKENNTHTLGDQVVREIVIPELSKEVNNNKNFARLRQIYNSLILATWYKKKIRNSILEQGYADKDKIAGVNISDPVEKDKIYQRYLKAFKKGVFNYIKEEQDLSTREIIPKKYFSGGAGLYQIDRVFSGSGRPSDVHESHALLKVKMDMAMAGQLLNAPPEVVQGPKKKPVYILLGGPAFGKGAVGSFLSGELDVPALSFGDVRRGIAVSNSEKNPSPQDTIAHLKSMLDGDQQKFRRGFVLDFSFSSQEAYENLVDMLETSGFSINKIIHVVAPKISKALERYLSRERRLEGRPVSVKRFTERLAKYLSVVKPIIARENSRKKVEVLMNDGDSDALRIKVKKLAESIMTETVKNSGAKIIGITGPPGSGKSSVARHIQEQGYFVIHLSDIYKPFPSHIAERLRRVFSPDYFNQRGNILLYKLSSQEYAAFQLMVRPYVKERILRQLYDLISAGNKHIFIEGIFLRDLGIENLLNHVLYIETPKEKRIQLRIPRDLQKKEKGEEYPSAMSMREYVEWTTEQYAKTIPKAERSQPGDIIIHNDGFFPDLIVKVKEYLKSLEDAAPSGQPEFETKLLNKGGIDFTVNQTPLEIKNDGKRGIKFYLDPAMLQQLRNIPGFVPVIVDIRPMTDLKRFLDSVDSQIIHQGPA